jgi:type III restriction enzyme
VLLYQQEFEEEENIKFGKIEKHAFANITIEKDGEVKYLEQQASEELWNYFNEKGYIDENGKVTDDLKRALKDNKLDFPEDYKEAQSQVAATLRKVAGNLNIKNADDKKKISINKRRFLSPEFKELWDKVKYKTTYAVKFDSSQLIKACAEEIMKNLKVDKAKMLYTKGGIEINAVGTNTEERTRLVMVIDDAGFSLPDIITYLQNETNLTRRTIVEILKQSKRLEDFKHNPQKFMDEVSSIIQRKMKYFIVDGIKYKRLGEDEFYAQELFENEELYGYLSKNMMESDKSVYEYEEKLYFVLETKGNILAEELRLREISKIACGHKHFEAVGNEVEFLETDNFNKFIENL